ncbi:hypothetical protein LTR62_003661 [Meristemomyces frigidus]|uniref:Uncharacterized protein n=1 Tax=Meristemomyces frigidus TaxID=1508187 RepID=A0AAN7TRL0_9PEZI|nr:hypothetical protein LTR62_003661 [Meristemomyces frigidus]
MPPKASKKVKAEVTPEPPAKTTPKATTKSAPRETPKKATPSKKTKEPTVYNSVTKDTTVPIPIDVQYEGISEQAIQTKAGGYRAGIRLDSHDSFSLVKTYMVEGGDYDGHQVILLKPAKPFKFLSLPEEARKRVYMFYLAPKGVTNDVIVLDGRRANKDLYAKTYAEGSKSRVALLAVNHEVHAEALPLLYATTIRLDSTTSLVDFMSQLSSRYKLLLKSLSIKSYIKGTSRNSMHFLAEARNLTRLYFESGVFAEGDPNKAAKAFYADAYKFLEAIGAARGDKAAGVDVLGFGKEALQFKDEGKVLRPWEPELVEEFKENLRLKLK